MDLKLTRELLNDIVSHPDSEDHRSVLLVHINVEWISEIIIVK